MQLGARRSAKGWKKSHLEADPHALAVPGDPPRGGFQLRPPLEADLVFRPGPLRQCMRTDWERVLAAGVSRRLKQKDPNSHSARVRVPTQNLAGVEKVNSSHTGDPAGHITQSHIFTPPGSCGVPGRRDRYEAHPSPGAWCPRTVRHGSPDPAHCTLLRSCSTAGPSGVGGSRSLCTHLVHGGGAWAPGQWCPPQQRRGSRRAGPLERPPGATALSAPSCL